ncbi:MAG: response regulator transcription factor [Bacteriovoracaceae bacterium]|nr:response regulator transcription factor [Bacteriovoracaceae bacterium]
MSQILVLEDDQKLGQLLSKYLKDKGFDVTLTSNREDFEGKLSNENKLIILDRLIGESDSKDHLLKIKKKVPTSAIMILSAINTPNEKAELLNMGADDYLGKPFSVQELTARINALLRRSEQSIPSFRKFGNTVVDYSRRTITVDASTERLPAKEFLVLSTLLNEYGRVWNKSDLLDTVWGDNLEVETNVVEVTITNLRRKLSNINSSLQVRNMRNAGYWIEE